MDNILTVLIFLFILSIITEKLVSLIRKYPGKFRVITLILTLYLLIVSVISCINSNFEFKYIILILIFLLASSFIINLFFAEAGKTKLPPLLSSPFKNIDKDTKGLNMDQQDKEITLLSFLIGFIVAFFSDASLFDLINLNPQQYQPLSLDVIFKEWFKLNPELEFDINGFIGLIATGFFLGFGSKFFHDVLELVFQIKNYRSKLSLPGTYQFDNIEDLEANLKITHGDIVHLVFEREKENVFAIKGVNGISVSMVKWNNESSLGIKITTTMPENITVEKFKYQMRGKGYYQVPVKIVKSEITTACFGITPSVQIKNKNVQKYGTLCFPVTDENKKIYFLTCYHVVKHKDHSWKQFSANGHEEVVDNNGSIGSISDVRFNDTIDAALIEKGHNIDLASIENKINNVVINKVRILNTNDVNNLQIKMKGATTTICKSGFISGINSIQIIEFEKNSIIKTISNLIELSDNNFGPLVKQGDSGALVYTDKGEAIGMVVATDNNESYAIPFHAILREFNVNLFLKT